MVADPAIFFPDPFAPQVPQKRQAIQRPRLHPEKLDKLSKGLDNTPEVAGIKKIVRREAAVRRDSGVRQYVPAVNIPMARQAPQRFNQHPKG